MLGAEEKNSEGPLSMGIYHVLDKGNMDILEPLSLNKLICQCA